jgi:hypothetical protein
MTHRIASRWSGVGEGSVVTTGPVLAGVLGPQGADVVLGFAFAEAQRRMVPLQVVVAGPALPVGADALLIDLIERWAEKYPAVSVTTNVHRGIDAAVVLAGATRGCGLVVVPKSADATMAVVLQALSRRTHCPLVVVRDTIAGAAPRP